MRRNHVLLGYVGALALLAACGGDGGNVGDGGAAGAPDDLGGSDQGEPGQQCQEYLVTPGQIDTATLVPADVEEPYGRNHLRQDRTHIYWEVTGSGSADLMRVAKSGGQPEILTTIDEYEFDFAVDPDGYVYIRTGSGVFRVPVTGGVTQPVWPLSIGTLSDNGVIATDDANIYVPKQSGACALRPSPIYQVSKSSGSATPFATITCPNEIVLDDQYVYVSADGGPQLEENNAVIGGKYPDASLFRISKDGGSPKLLAKVPYGLSSIQVTASYVYGLLEERASFSGGRTVVRIPVAGGPFERLGDLSCVQAKWLRVFEDHAYYASGLLVRTDLDGKNLSTFDLGMGNELALDVQVDDGVVFSLGGDGFLQRNKLR